MSSNKLYRDEEWLRKRVRQGHPPGEIAESCSVTESTIERWIEKHNLRPYRDEEWLAQQINQYVSERAIAEWCGVTSQTVKRWMKKFDIKHPGLASASVMRSFLGNRFKNPDEVSTEAQISVLWQRYRVHVQYAEIARAVGATPQHVRDTVGAESGGDIGQLIDAIEFLGSESVPDDVAEKVRARDSEQCVRCGSTTNIEIHHIIPGESTLENLALLCRDCHQEAHGDDFYSSDLTYDTLHEFWNDWVE